MQIRSAVQSLSKAQHWRLLPSPAPCGANEDNLGKMEQREAAMRAVVGIRKHRANEPGAVEEVRALRRGSRIDCLSRQ